MCLVVKGVVYLQDRSCYTVDVRVKGEHRRWGRFATTEEAAKAHDR